MNWNSIIVQTLLKGNFIAGPAATVASNYATAGNLSDANITKAGGEFSFAAIVDAILEAYGMIVGAIGNNVESEYRPWFADDTATILSGGLIPKVGTTGKPRYGMMSDMRDAADGKTFLSFQPRGLIDVANKFWPRNKQEIYQYWTDNLRVWHTRPAGAIGSIVTWDRPAERALILSANNTTPCPLPDSLIPVLTDFGGLAFIYRDVFNSDSAGAHLQLFQQELLKISGQPPAVTELNTKN